MNRLSDFYYELFDRIFTLPFQPYITERLRRDAVARQVQEAAGAASQALTRFLVSERSTKHQVTEILESFKFLRRANRARYQARRCSARRASLFMHSAGANV